MSRLALLCLLAACRIDGDIGVDSDFEDNDGDGFSEAEGDCDDTLAAVAPGLPEACDGLDNDCNDVIDGLTCERTDEFTSTPVLDVLLVVDNSLTMSAEQEQIARSMPDLAEELIRPEHDVHIGVVSTDMADPMGQGRLVEVGGQRYASGNWDPDLASGWLADAVALGVDGSAIEQARAAIVAAIDDHNLAENEGFRRADAHLGVLILSDEDDQTQVPTIPDFLMWMDERIGLERTRVHAIVGVDEPPECDEQPGTDHLTVVGATQGTSLSICEPDFGPFLVGLSQLLVNDALPGRFVLRDAADPTTISVEFRNDGFVDLLDDDAFVYDVPTQTVVVDSKRPPAGATVTVRYDALPM